MNTLIKALIVCTISIFLFGCASTDKRMARLKKRKENIVYTSVKGSIAEAKSVISQTGREFGLVELKELERDDFMTFRGNMPSLMGDCAGGVIAGGPVLGGVAGGYMSNYTRLGIFFNYDKSLNITQISIVEEIGRLYHSRRDEFVSKMKIVELRRLADRQTKSYSRR